MLARLENRFEYSPESEKLMQAYYKFFSKGSDLETNSKIPVGIAWLKKIRIFFLAQSSVLLKLGVAQLEVG